MTTLAPKEQALVQVGIVKAASESAAIYGENVVLNASRGHGFAAEKANHLHDVLTLEKATHDGIDLRKYGADRTVNGVQIQTKYCSKGASCISECFVDGQFVYWTDQGLPMQIEVPHNKWDDAVKAMRRRIEKGEVVLERDGRIVASITDPDQAPSLVRQGHYDYETVQAIAKSGTVESLTFDSINGIRLAGTAAGVTAVLTYANAIWNGQSTSIALEAACYAGLKVGGVAWATSIVTAQLGRTGLEAALVPSAKAVVNWLGCDVAGWLATGAGKKIAGASAKNFIAKQFRGSVTAAIASTIILSTTDLFRMFDGKLSFGQLFKNVAVTGAGVAGGIGGFSAGAAQGAAWGSFIPGPGNLIGGAIGGFLGALAGSSTAQGAASFVLDGLIADDAKQMLAILQDVFAARAKVYLLTKQEAETVLSHLSEIELPVKLRDMFAATDRTAFAKDLLEPMLEVIAAKRSFIALPSDEDLLRGFEEIIKKADDPAPATLRVFNKEGSISIDVPSAWQKVNDESTQSGLPTYIHGPANMGVWHSISEITSRITTQQYAESFRNSHGKSNPDMEVSDLIAVTIAGRQAYQFSYTTITERGKPHLVVATIVRLVKYWCVLWVHAPSHLIEAHRHVLDDWRNSVTVRSINNDIGPEALSVTSGDENFTLIVPPGWKNEEKENTELFPHRKFYLSLGNVATVDIHGFVTTDNAVTLCSRFIEHMKLHADLISSSITEHVINSRPAMTVRLTSTFKDEPITDLFTVMQFDDCVVTFTAVVSGKKIAERIEQCEAIPWRLFRCV